METRRSELHLTVAHSFPPKKPPPKTFKARICDKSVGILRFKSALITAWKHEGREDGSGFVDVWCCLFVDVWCCLFVCLIV